MTKDEIKEYTLIANTVFGEKMTDALSRVTNLHVSHMRALAKMTEPDLTLEEFKAWLASFTPQRLN